MKKAINYIEDYRTKQLEKKSKNTVEAYLSDLNQFLVFLNKDLEEVSNKDIVMYTTKLLGIGLKAKTVNRKLVSIRRYIEYLNKLEDFTEKIFVEVELIKIQRQEYLEEILEKTDYDRLIRMAERENDLRAKAIFNTLYLTGARVSEMLQLKRIDVYKDMIMIKGKGSKYRDLFVPENLKWILQEYIKARGGESEFIFINEENENTMSRQAVHKIIKAYAGKARVKLSKAHAHNFRHLCAIRLLEEGLTLDEVADIMGHTDINTTRIYTRKTKKQLFDVIKRLS